MTRSLSLRPAHAAEGARFVEDMGFELPAAYGPAGAELEEQRLVAAAAGLIDRSYRGVVDLSGNDVRKVFNKVFSSPVEQLEVGQGQASALLSHRGRLLGAFHLFLLENGDLRLVFFEPLREELVQAIHKYAFLSDIALRDRTAEVAILSVEGRRAREALELAAPGCDVPVAPLTVRALQLGPADGAAVGCSETPDGGFDVWIPVAEVADAWARLLAAVRAVGGGPVGHAAAEALRIEAGCARQGREYDAESFPPDAQWEHALTYDKCYVGQEVVARMKTFGQANQHLAGLILESQDALATPATVRVGEEEAGRATSAARSARLGKVIALAVLKRRFWGAPNVQVMSPEGERSARVMPLPLVRLDGPSPS
ncbi:MAG TPA: glycine cleavage T C-terminal barrel domain-containing protein [Planctomycetota bacterium]|nr:glycine cleavage T C-terminal barrel domain-containing protein [Planctomycetota bacterium]